jgi:hypothetical protein
MNGFGVPPVFCGQSLYVYVGVFHQFFVDSPFFFGVALKGLDRFLSVHGCLLNMSAAGRNPSSA